MDPELLISAAAANGKVDRILELLDEDPGLAKSYDPDGWTALHVAGHFGQLEAARVLLEAGADPVAKSKNHLKNHAIHTATAGRHPEVVRLLIEAGADPDAAEADGATALYRAAERGDVATAQILLAAGADPNLEDESGRGPFLIALEKGNEEIIHLLRSYEE